MNLRRIANFWRKNANTKGSAGVSSGNPSERGRAASQDPHDSWQRHTAVFENNQAALYYIQSILESRRPLVRDAFRPSANRDGNPVFSCTVFPDWTSPPLSKDALLALRCERAEMLGLLDLCLLVIPDDTPPEPVADAPVTNFFTQHHWRQLLCRIVCILLETDRTIYTEVFIRPRHTREPPTPSGSSLSTPCRLSIRSTATPLSATLSVDVPASCKQSAAPGTPILTANARKATVTAEGHHPVSALANSLRGADEEFSLLSSLTTWATLRAILHRQLDAQRPRTNVTRSMSPVSSGADLHTQDQGTEASVSGATAVFAVPWDDVVTELTDILGGVPRRMVEALISLWILHDPDRELVRCVVQRPLRPHSAERDMANPTVNPFAVTSASAVTSAPGTAATSGVAGTATVVMPSLNTHITSNSMHTVASLVVASAAATAAASDFASSMRTSEGTKNSDCPLHPSLTSPLAATSTAPATPILTVPAPKRPCVVDDLVEQVERLYEQNVLQAWVAYVDDSIPMLFERSHDEVTSFDVHHCNRMAAFAVASPYWAEEKRREIFQRLCEAWNETNDPLSPAAAHRAGVLSAFPTTQTDATVTAITSIAVSAESPLPAVLLDDQVHPLHAMDSRLTRPTPERQSRSDVGNHSFLSASLHSLTECVLDRRDSVRAAPDDDGVLSMMLHLAWAAALHTRVAQCVQVAQPHQPRELFPESPRAGEAERLALEERDVAAVGGSHAARQRALESLLYARLAVGGGGGDALSTAEMHFANAKGEWVEGRQGLASALAYLESMALLARAQAECGADEAVSETVQIAIPQVAVCEEALANIAPPPICNNNNNNGSISNEVHDIASGTTLLVRQAEARRRILRAKCAILREGWRAHYRLGDTAGAARFFEDYLGQLKCLQRSQREAETYAALTERGEQLEHEKRYGNAVAVFKQAVECVKNAIAAKPRSASPDSVVNVGVNVNTALTGNVHDGLHTVTITATTRTTTGTGLVSPVEGRDEGELRSSSHVSELSAPCATPAVTDRDDRMIEWMRCEAESERNLALAYVLQAEHEVNVRQRRQQLSNAVNSAYAAQNALQRWTLKVKPPIGGTLLDVAASLVAAAKALLRLGQPKKAALLLEPLIEEKANSASVRPTRWTNAMEHISAPIAVTEITTCVQTLLVRIATYDVHTQCLSRFDGERARSETSRALEFTHQAQAWAEGLLAKLGKRGTAARSLRQCLRATLALQRALTITCGDALVTLAHWEDALLEYSNALASFADGGDVEKNCSETAAEQERVRGDCRMGESLVLAKLAEVYIALDKPKTAIHYYNQVLEYASDIDDALLQYNAHIHLARLYTATGLTEEASAQWSKVSALAKEYEDQEISRETMRSIVAAQCAAGMYQNAIKTAEELDLLASAAEGVDAAADRRFALEAIADAQLQLGQYKKCISALDEREKVQDKEGKLSGVLFSMRARALIGDGATQEAIKVLTTWATQARTRGSWIEVGHANVALALAYATTFRVLRAKRHHQIVLAAFADVGEMSKECRHAVLESARWLVHDFYLNDEEVPLDPIEPLPAAPSAITSVSSGALGNNTGSSAASSSIGGAAANPSVGGSNGHSVSSSAGAGAGAGGGGGGGITVSNSASGATLASGGACGARTLKRTSPPAHTPNGNNGLDDYQVSNDSGDLSVLLRYDEQRLNNARHRNSSGKDSVSSNGDCSSSSNEDNSHNDDDSSDEMSGGGACVTTELTNNSLFDLDLTGILDDNNTGFPMATTKKTHRSPPDDVITPRGNQAASLSEKIANPQQPQPQQQQSAKPTSTLANVSLCKRLALLESDNLADLHSPVDLTESKQQQQLRLCSETSDEMCDDNAVREQTMVRTLCYHRALETMEAAAQISMMPPAMRQRLVPRSPAEAVDLALLTFPRCTFVFYFAEFAAQYSVVVRPAGRPFFMKRSVQAYMLKDFHSKKFVPIPTQNQSQQPQQQQQQQSAAGLGNSSMESAPSENRLSALASSLSSIRRRSHGNSAETSLRGTISGVAAQSPAHETIEWNAVADELQQSLRDLHADLWAPVGDLLRFAGCSTDEAECLVLVVDPSLLHVPFPALVDTAGGDATPLGQRATLIVTPTVGHFMHSTRRMADPISFDSSAEQRCVFLPESPPTGGDSGAAEALAESAWLAETARPWTLYSGCTRKEMISAFSSPCCRALMILCDPVGHMFKVADGMVRLGDLTRGCPFLPETLDLAVVTNERLNEPSVDEPGVAARLCLDHGCTRVLRVDLPHGMGITAAHQELVKLYLKKLNLAIDSRMRFPYALALRMAQEEAQRSGMNIAVWASLTLIGAP